MSGEILRISEIYRSIQGESTFAGLPCVFVRLTGCSLRCTWCDTAHAFEGGAELPVDEVARRALAFGIPVVEITGGEPLEQPGFHALTARLLDAGRTVLVETGGHVPLAGVDPRVVKIVDWKAPGSGMERHNMPNNVAHLGPRDEVKIVVADRRDFEWAEARVRESGIAGRVAVILVSPAWKGPSLEEVAGWVRDSDLPLRLNLQLHKFVWGEREGV